MSEGEYIAMAWDKCHMTDAKPFSSSFLAQMNMCKADCLRDNEEMGRILVVLCDLAFDFFIYTMAVTCGYCIQTRNNI